MAFCISFAAFVFAFWGPAFVEFWVGKDLMVESALYYLFAVYIAFTAWSNVFAYFVNAIGELGLQLATALVAAVLNILLSIYFVNILGMGVEGVVMATLFSLSIYCIFGPIQVLRITRA